MENGFNQLEKPIIAEPLHVNLDFGFEELDLHEEQQRMQDKFLQEQQHVPPQTMTKSHVSKSVKKSSNKKGFFAALNPWNNKDEGVEKSEQKIVTKIQGYQSVKKEDDFNGAMARQVRQNEELLEKCNKERQFKYANASFKSVLKVIESYANAKDYDTQQKMLHRAMQEIQNYVHKHSDAKTENDIDLLERMKKYQYFFEKNTNGMLNVGTNVKIRENPSAGFFNKWKSVKSYQLFPHEPHVNDVKQRMTEDCYMLSALSAMAYLDASQIKEGLRDNNDGTVTVRFYADDEKEVFYENESVQDMFKQGMDTEEQKVKLLTKLMSTYFQDEKFLSECVKNRHKTKGFQVEVGKTSQKIHAEKIEDNESVDELLEDLEVMEISSVKQSVSQEELSETEYTKRAKDNIEVWSSNNSEYYEKMIKHFLASDGIMQPILESVISRFQEPFNQEDEKRIMQSLMHEFVTRNTFSQTAEYYRSLKKENTHKQIVKPVYVRVKKEITSIGGGIELNATDSLWVQMIEKAYATRFRSNDRGDGYAGISRGQSADFLKRFTNQNYEQRDIYSTTVQNVIDDGGAVIISKTDLRTVMKDIRMAKNKSLSIENIMEMLRTYERYKTLTAAQEERIKNQLERDGYMHEAFSGIYTEIAENVFTDIENRLNRKEIITVGVSLNGLSAEEKTKRKKDLNDTGIRTGHAYAITRCFEQDGHKFLTLRDPYGLFRRTYDIVKEDNKIVEYKKVNSSASVLSLEGSDTMGMFNMELNDFLETFDMYSGIKKAR